MTEVQNGQDPQPDQIRRFRCTACGNLTRFDVTITRKQRSFYHYTVGGELEIEESDTLSESVDDVICRWCGHGRSIEELESPTS